MPKLLVKHPEQGEITFKLTGDRITVGRRADNTIQINHGTISGHHAELVSVNGHYVLRDLDSTNHCFVDGFQISEADLNERCKLMIGTIECEYLPDPEAAKLAGAEASMPSTSDSDALRKMVGALRHQNDELIQKVSEQQKQIDILGSARLLTPATGADLESLRGKVKSLTAERDQLAKENRGLLAEVDRLRAIVALSGEPGTLKSTIRIPPPDETAEIHLPTVAVSASGGTTVAAPVARVVDPQIATFAAMTGLCGRIAPVIENLRADPGAKAAKEELATVCTQLSEKGTSVNGHTTARLANAIDALTRDVCQRSFPVAPRILDTVAQAADLLGRALSAELLPKCAALSAPNVLVVDDDKDLLPAILASLEFARLSASGCGTASDAMASVQANPCDLVLLDISLPGTDGLDLCTQIRALPKHERTPIVFITGHNDAQNRGQGMLNGGNDFISKPFNMFELTLKAHVWAVKNQLGLA